MTSFFQGRVRWLAHVLHPKKKSSTAAISRNHVIEVDESTGLVSLMGGKWTAYRVQGEQTTDKILADYPDLKQKVKHEQGQTLNFNLIGSYSKVQITDGLQQPMDKTLQQYEDHFVFDYDMHRDIAKHLLKTYGTTSKRIVDLGHTKGMNKRLSEDYPFLESEVLFAIQHEMAQKPNDVVCRRVPVSFIDTKTTDEVILPKVVDIFKKEFKWSAERAAQELAEARKGLASMK